MSSTHPPPDAPSAFAPAAPALVPRVDDLVDQRRRNRRMQRALVHPLLGHQRRERVEVARLERRRPFARLSRASRRAPSARAARVARTRRARRRSSRRRCGSVRCRSRCIVARARRVACRSSGMSSHVDAPARKAKTERAAVRRRVVILPPARNAEVADLDLLGSVRRAQCDLIGLATVAAASAATIATPTADDPPNPAPDGKSLCTSMCSVATSRKRRAAASAID